MAVDLVPAARNVVAALRSAGVDHFFTVPGESFLALLDELHDAPDIRVVTCRHEGGAAFMAEAYAALTRRPAACAGTRAVGAANLAIGIHTALQDSTPMLAILGQVDSSARGREAFQEAQLDVLLGTVSTWANEPTTAADLGTATLEAGRRALAGRQGPACVAYREDLLVEPVAPEAYAPVRVERPGASPEEARAALAALASAERPLLVVGLDVIASGAVGAAVELAHRHGLPVVSTWRHPDAFPNDDPAWVGHAGLSRLPCVADMLRQSDLWLVVGDRLDENTLAGYTLPGPGTTVVRVALDAEGDEIRSGAREFLDAMLEHDAGEIPPGRLERVAALRGRWEDESTPRPRPAGEVAEGCVDQLAVVETLRRLLPAGTVVVSDAGNFSGWPARYLRWNEPGTFLGPVSGAMGYAVPGAIGARLARPDRPVVALAGDGGFLMTANELATAAAEGVDITVVVLDNHEYGTIRMHQQRAYPGRPVATALGGVDCAALARALGGQGWTVRDVEAFGPALEAAMAYAGPAVIHVRTDPTQLAVGQYDPR